MSATDNTVPAADRPAQPAAPASPWPVFLTVSIASFLVSIDATVLYAAFSALRSSFASASPAQLSWVLNAYTVVYAALLVPAGRMADSLGRKKTFLLGTSIFLAASTACGVSSDVGILIGARAFQAIGAALLTPSSLALVLAAFPVERRAVAVSMWGAVGALAAAVGPGLGSILVDTLGWRWAFFINVPPAIWALIRARTQIPAERRTGRVANVDLIGVALLIVGMGALTAAVIAFGEHAASAQVGWLSAALGVVCILLFVFWANFQEEPALDLSLFANRTYSAVNLATLAFGIAFTMMFFGFFFFMTGIWKYSLPMAGVAVTPGPLLVIPVAMLSGRAAARVGHRPFLIGGSLLVAAGGVWQAIVPGVEPSYVLHWLPSQLVTGIGVGMALPSFSGAAVASLGPSRFGVGSAVNQALRQFGSVVGVALTVVIAGGNHFDLTRFQTLAQTYAGFAVLAALLCLPVKTRPGP